MQLIAEVQGNSVAIIGLSYDDDEQVKCEGCGELSKDVYETEDSVMLCRPCFKSCAEDGKD